MVYLERPGGEESFRESGPLFDHEHRALDRFRCPACEAPLELMESPAAGRAMLSPIDDSCELIAACRLCDVTFTQDAWHAWLDSI